MKVICIKEPSIAHSQPSGRQVDCIPLVVGKCYTVINSKTLLDKNTYYNLEETKFPDMTVWHNSKMFATVSGIDETEMERDWMCVKNKV